MSESEKQLQIERLKENLKAIRLRLRNSIYVREPSIDLLEDLQLQITDIKLRLSVFGLKVRRSKYD